jgi:hypothetical protein
MCREKLRRRQKAGDYERFSKATQRQVDRQSCREFKRVWEIPFRIKMGSVE